MTEDIARIMKLLRIAVCQALGMNVNAFAKRWEAVEHDFKKWLSRLPAEISPLTRDLELLRRICEAFGKPSLKHDPKIIDIVLAGTAKSGDMVPVCGQAAKIINRDISDRFSIIYILEDEKGDRITHEFFD